MACTWRPKESTWSLGANLWAAAGIVEEDPALMTGMEKHATAQRGSRAQIVLMFVA